GAENRKSRKCCQLCSALLTTFRNINSQLPVRLGRNLISTNNSSPKKAFISLPIKPTICSVSHTRRWSHREPQPWKLRCSKYPKWFVTKAVGLRTKSQNASSL